MVKSTPKGECFGGSENPQRLARCPPHSKKCVAWIAISKHGIIRLLIVENDHGSMKLQKYKVLDKKKQWVKKDGDTHQTTYDTVTWLHKNFERILSAAKPN